MARCPHCGSLVAAEEAICPACGLFLQDPAIEVQPLDGFEPTADALGYSPAIPSDQEAAAEKDEDAGGAEALAARACQQCGVPNRRGLRICANCGSKV